MSNPCKIVVVGGGADSQELATRPGDRLDPKIKLHYSVHGSMHGPNRPGDVRSLAVRLNVVYPEHGYPCLHTQRSRGHRRG